MLDNIKHHTLLLSQQKKTNKEEEEKENEENEEWIEEGIEEGVEEGSAKGVEEEEFVFFVKIVNKRGQVENSATCSINPTTQKITFHLYTTSNTSNTSNKDTSTKDASTKDASNKDVFVDNEGLLRTSSTFVDGDLFSYEHFHRQNEKRYVRTTQYLLTSIHKMERHFIKQTQMKLYIGDGSFSKQGNTLKILFSSHHALQTFAEVVHVLQESVWIVDDGEWVDECSEEVICYRAKHSTSSTKKRTKILCFNRTTGTMHLLEQNIYNTYLGRKGMFILILANVFILTKYIRYLTNNNHRIKTNETFFE